MLTVSPGRLGITLEKNSHDKIGGAVITNIDPTLCTFLHLIEVGDRIYTIDGKRVTRLLDVILGKDRERQFGILKKAVADAMMKEYNNQLVGGNQNSSNASPTKLSKSNDTVDPCSSREGNHSTTVVATNDATATTPGRKQKQFPLLTSMNAHIADRPSERLREDIMTELLQWDKKHDKKVSCCLDGFPCLRCLWPYLPLVLLDVPLPNHRTFSSFIILCCFTLSTDFPTTLTQTEAKMGSSRYQVLCVPLRRQDKVNKREFDNKCFYAYNKQTKLFHNFLGAWASYCDGTQEDAAKMVLHYMAKQFPKCYVENFELATNMNERKRTAEEGGGRGKKKDIPPNFVSYDGTNDVKWNMKYGELIQVSMLSRKECVIFRLASVSDILSNHPC